MNKIIAGIFWIIQDVFFKHKKTFAISSPMLIPHTVKPIITNTSEEFIKCRPDNFSMSFILYNVNFSFCENK